LDCILVKFPNINVTSLEVINHPLRLYTEK